MSTLMPVPTNTSYATSALVLLSGHLRSVRIEEGTPMLRAVYVEGQGGYLALHQPQLLLTDGGLAHCIGKPVIVTILIECETKPAGVSAESSSVISDDEMSSPKEAP